MGLKVSLLHHVEERMLRLGLFAIVREMEFRDPSQFALFNLNKVPEERVNGILRDLLQGVRKGNADTAILESIREHLASECSRERKLLLYKLLEEMIIQSPDESMWREATSMISTVLYGGHNEYERVMVNTVTSEEQRTAAACLTNIYREVEDQRKRRVITESMISSRKTALAMDCILGSMFAPQENVALYGMRKTSELLGERMEVMAALTAYTLATGGYVHPAYPSMLDPLLASEEAGLVRVSREDVINAICAREQLLESLLGGFGMILDPTRIKLPHPWYEDEPGRVPLPKMDEGGIMRSSFEALAAIGGGRCLRLAIERYAMLLAPHLGLPESRGRTSGHLEGCAAFVAGRIDDIAANVRGYKHSKAFTRAIIGYPRDANAPSATDLHFDAHLFLPFIEGCERVRIEREPIARRAERYLVAGIGRYIEENDAEGITVRGNVDTVIARHQRLLCGSEDECERTKALFKRVLTRIKPANQRENRLVETLRRL